MKKILVLSALIGTLTGCTDSYKSATAETSKPTMYRYGQVVQIKEGFYREYGCLMLQEYEGSVFCKIVTGPDGGRVQERFERNENFDKSNVQLIEEPEQ